MAELWEAALREAAAPARGSSGPARLRDIAEPPGRRRDGAATRDARRPRAPHARRAPPRTSRSSGVDPLRRDAEGFRWRTRSQIEEGRSWLWVEDGVILFKAEASAWTPSAVQLQQVWVDPLVRRQGYGARGLRGPCRLLLERVPAVWLFVRAENTAAIRLYESIGMEPRARLPLPPLLAVETLILARHAFAVSNRGTAPRRARLPARGSRPRGSSRHDDSPGSLAGERDRPRRRDRAPAHAGDARARARRPRRSDGS